MRAYIMYFLDIEIYYTAGCPIDSLVHVLINFYVNLRALFGGSGKTRNEFHFLISISSFLFPHFHFLRSWFCHYPNSTSTSLALVPQWGCGREEPLLATAKRGEKKFAYAFQLAGLALVAPMCFALHCLLVSSQAPE